MGFLSKLILGRDLNGYVTNEIPWPGDGQSYNVALTQDVEQTLTVPAWAYHIKFAVMPGGGVWIGYGSVALLPATGSFTTANSESNPILRPAFDSSGTRITTLRFLAANDSLLNVVFYPAYPGEIAR